MLRVLTFSIFTLLISVATIGYSQIIVDDSFEDGITNNGPQQIGFNVTNNIFALNVNQGPGPLDFASGNFGRTIHGLFPAQTLNAFGDVLNVSFDFTTPASIANDNGFPSSNEDFKFGLFDTSGTAGAIDVNTLLPIDFNGPILTSSGTPNTALNGLAGFFGEIDNINAAGTDLGIRTNNVNGIVGPASQQTGQFLQSNTGFDFIAGGADDIVSLAPNTDYTGSISVRFSDASLTSLEITIGMALANNPLFDSLTTTVSIADIPGAQVGVNTTTFDLLAFNATSGAFGGTDNPAIPGSSTVGEANNGIDISNVTITFGDVDPVLLGDVNLDGVVNFFDIAPFIGILTGTNGVFQVEADVNEDGAVTFFDIATFIAILAE